MTKSWTFALSPDQELAILRQMRAMPLQYPVRRATPEKGPPMQWCDVTEAELGPKIAELSRPPFVVVNVCPCPAAGDWRIFYRRVESFAWTEGV